MVARFTIHIFSLMMLFIIIFSLQKGGDLVLSTTVTLVATPTTTPIPARDLDLLSRFENLMKENNTYCTLPCWWGFVPGETPFDEVLTLVERNDFGRQWKDSIYAETLTMEEFIRGEVVALDFQDSFYDTAANFMMSFGIDQNDFVQSIRINFINPGEWLKPEFDTVSLPKLFSQLEEIPEIYILENPSTFRISDYRLLMHLPEKGIEIWYTFDLTQDNPINVPLEHLRLCLGLRRTQSIQLTLSQPFEAEPLSEHYQTPETAYGIGIPTEEFVEFFREHPDECLDVEQYQIEHAE